MHMNYTYKETLSVSERTAWRVDDIIGGDKRLDFSKPFMPESFARTAPLDFLSAAQKRTLNQIRGHAYLSIFGLVEEFILPFVMDHARPSLRHDDHQTRALLQFACEEAKHIHLFKRFREDFARGFGAECAVIGPAEAIAAAILAHDPLAVALVILHIEWMTQRHYLDSVKDDQDLDPQFKSLLKHHWMEESQHAKLDTLMVRSLAAGRDAASIGEAVAGYAKIGAFLDEGLRQQTAFDLESFENATGRRLNGAERERFLAVQHQANRWTYLGSGMTHPNVLATLESIKSGTAAAVEAMAKDFC